MPLTRSTSLSKRLSIALEVIVLATLSTPYGTALAQEATPVTITTPADGAVLTGVVAIRGALNTGAFLSADLAFAYADRSSDEWFRITDVPQTGGDVQLALWDTTAISDGAYILRLRLNGTDGTVHDAVIRVEVRNYTSAPTPTPSVTPTGQPVLHVATAVQVAVTPTMTRVPAEKPTPLPPNPAALTGGDLLLGFARGGFAVLAVFLLWGAVTLRRRP